MNFPGRLHFLRELWPTEQVALHGGPTLKANLQGPGSSYLNVTVTVMTHDKSHVC